MPCCRISSEGGLPTYMNGIGVRVPAAPFLTSNRRRDTSFLILPLNRMCSFASSMRFVLLALVVLFSPLVSSSHSQSSSSSSTDAVFSVSVRLVHRDAPRSVLKSSSVEASRQSLPAEMPLKELLVTGRAMRERARAGKGRKKGSSGGVAERFSYLGESVGDFYVTMGVGSPPQKLVFIMDTGSELTWTRCRPCKVCSRKGGGPSFEYGRSATYRGVPCASPLCSQSLGFVGGACGNATAAGSGPSPCVFQLQYGDRSEDGGYISVDAFGVGVSGGGKSVERRLVFGCAVVEIDAVPTPNSGIAGLNAGPFSMASQLLQGARHKKLSYCLPDRLTALNSTGPLLFGDYPPPAALRYTPLVPPYSPMGSLYYYVGVNGISVGASRLNISSRYLVGDPTSGVGGTVLDSGTAITHLVHPVYDAVVRAMASQTSHMRPFAAFPSLGLDLCYNISANAADLPRVPAVTFHLLGGADLVFDYRSILFAAELVGDTLVVCLAFADSGSTQVSSLNVIGNYQQQNYWVEYDLDNSRVGLAKANCAKY